MDPGRAVDPSGITVGIEVFEVEPPYDQDRIVYRKDPKSPECGFYSYHRWAAPISRMLPRLTADGLTGMPGVSVITPIVAGGRYDALLAGTVVALVEVDTHDGHEAQVRLRLELRRPTGESIWDETLDQMMITRSATVEAVVKGMNAALSDLIRQARPGIEAAIASAEFTAE